MMPFSRGDVVIENFPNSDLETFKTRPALVVQASDLRTGISQTAIVMITTKLERLGHRSRVLSEVASPLGESSRLYGDSVIMTDNIVTVRDEAISSTLGALADMKPVDAALRHTLGL